MMGIWLIIEDEKCKKVVLCQHIRALEQKKDGAINTLLYYCEVGEDNFTFVCSSYDHDVDRIFDAVEAAIKSGRNYVKIKLEEYRRHDR